MHGEKQTKFVMHTFNKIKVKYRWKEKGVDHTCVDGRINCNEITNEIRGW
jgi:hypothetical protein